LQIENNTLSFDLLEISAMRKIRVIMYAFFFFEKKCIMYDINKHSRY